MNLDTYLDAAEGCSNMKDFKRNLGRKSEALSSAMQSLEEAFRD